MERASRNPEASAAHALGPGLGSDYTYQLIRRSALRQGRQGSNLRPPVLETGALPAELRPSVAGAWYRALGGTIRRVQRRLLGLLFAVLAAGLALIALYSALSGGAALVVAFAAAVLAIWMGDLARRVLVRRRS